MRGIKLKFQLNEKFGRLTAIKDLNKSCKIGRNARRSVWLFRCDCGNEIEITACDVKYGRKKSCGCLQKEYQSNLGSFLRVKNTKPDKDGPLTKLFGNYKRSAIRRGYEWHLTKDDFRHFINQNCFYCGEIPKTEIYVARKKTLENTLIYNGVDRKNNNIGYTKENCISACGICNRMKMDLDFDTFISVIKKINQNLCD